MKYITHFGLKRLLGICTGALMALLLVIGLTGPAQAATSASIPSSITVMAATGKSCPAAVKSRPTLRVGATGACVKVMQQLLINKGYNVGAAKADGIYGSYTKSAVVKFQRNSKLLPDAIVGPVTWGALVAKKAMNNKQPSSSPAILTFDDCPRSKSSANATLKAANSLKIHLRLYVTGDCLKRGNFDIAYARKMGHTVCSHSNTHASLPSLSLAGIRKEMTVKGLKTNCARPPYGAVNNNVRKVFKEKGLRLDLWTVDTNDWRGKSKSQVVNYVIANTRSGSVVLMHMQHKAFNESALRSMKSGLNKRGIAVK